MSHTQSDSGNQKVLTYDDSLSDINIKVERFYLSHLSEDDQKGILITAETEKFTTEKRIPLKLEHPDYFGLILLNYKGPQSNDYFPLNSTVKVKEILLRKSGTEINCSDLRDQLENIIKDRIRLMITKDGYDCRYLCEKTIEDKYTVVLQMKLEIIETNNFFRQFSLYLDDGSGILLCHAIENKNMETIEILLNLKFNINARNEADQTPLHVAAAAGNENVVDFLISKGADVNATNKQGQVPLHYAVGKTNLKILDSLLRNQANPNAKDEDGQTPLYYAVAAGNVDVVDILLKRGADYKLKDIYDHTPFHLAIIHVNLDMIKVFLDNNVDANVVNSRKQTPLHAIGETISTSISFGVKATDKDTYLKIINALLRKGANINFRDTHGSTPLHHAVMNKNSEYIRALLECNADPAIENDGDNVLRLALKSGRANECIRVLLDSYVDINAVNRHGDTALHMAIQWNHYNIVESILKKNPNIGIKNDIGYTALHEAVKFQRYHMVHLLLLNGANVDLTNADGRTALHLAIELNIHSIIILLLENKANVNLKGLSGKTALHLATDSPGIPIEIIKSIVNSTDNVNAKDEHGRTALHYAALNVDDRTLERLLKVKADVNVKDFEGNTPLHLTMSQEYSYTLRFKCMKVLVNYQADVNAVNNDMSTPLHHACRIKNAEAVKYLIKNGADSSMRDRDGRTVFHYACMMMHVLDPDMKEIFKNFLDILFEEDVSVNCVDKFGKTPLHYFDEEDNYGSSCFYEPLLKIGADINIENEDQKTVIDICLIPRYILHYSNYKPFIEHVIKMQEVGMWVRKKTLDIFNEVNDQYDLQKIKRYKRNCRKEVDLMNTNIDQSDITYYDFLKTSPHKAMNYTRNENVVNAIQSDELLAVFPIYGHFLKCHLRDIQQRCNLHEKIQRFLKSNIFERLSTDCMHEIFQYLNYSDLDNFLQALKPVVLIE